MLGLVDIDSQYSKVNYSIYDMAHVKLKGGFILLNLYVFIRLKCQAILKYHSH